MPLADTVASRARWPSKVNLFLAAGRAPVITRIGDLAFLLEREGAAVVANCDAGDLADKLATLLNDAALRERCERRARYVAEHLLSWPLLTARLEDFYWWLRGKTRAAAASEAGGTAWSEA
jgi:glycosyltransferase involved in cell wall biosynthesis